MPTEVRQLDTTELEQRVKRMYEEVALEPEREFHFETGRPLAERLGYPAADLDRIPAAAIDSFAGVGYFLDLAAIAARRGGARPRQRLGHGQLPRRARGRPDGRVDRRRHDRRAARQGRAARRRARLRATSSSARATSSSPPVEDAQLRLRDLQRRHQPLARQAGGVRGRGPRAAAGRAAGARRHRQRRRSCPRASPATPSLWAACIGGAMQRDGYREAIEAAGFEIETWRENTDYRFVSERADNATQKYGVTSISLLAVRVKDEHTRSSLTSPPASKTPSA